MKNKLSQVTKKASEVPADPGTDIVVFNTAVKGPALKGSFRWEDCQKQRLSLPSHFSLGRAFGLTGPPSLEKNPAPNSISNLLWLCSTVAECLNI